MEECQRDKDIEDPVDASRAGIACAPSPQRINLRIYCPWHGSHSFRQTGTHKQIQLHEQCEEKALLGLVSSISKIIKNLTACFLNIYFRINPFCCYNNRFSSEKASNQILELVYSATKTLVRSGTSGKEAWHAVNIPSHPKGGHWMLRSGHCTCHSNPALQSWQNMSLWSSLCAQERCPPGIILGAQSS